MEQIEFCGFHRILIHENGEAIPPRRAAEDYGLVPVVGYRRKDGWSLGAPVHLQDAALNLWRDEWTHVIHQGERFWKPLDNNQVVS